MPAIPIGLLEQVERGNVLLFVGERVVRDAERRVFIDLLTAELATRCNVARPDEYTFAEAAQVYEDRMGRHALVEFVRSEYEKLGNQPQRVHRLIASFHHSKVLVTTCIDQRIECACADVGRPLHLVVRGIDIPFDDERKTRLYKLRGSVEQIESLVLTEADYERFYEEHESMSVVLKAHLASKSILFLGYDLGDPQFRTLYRKVTDLLDAYARRAYAFGETPSQRVARWCKRHGIEIVESGATEFLEALHAQLADRQTQSTPMSATVAQLPPVDSAATTILSDRPYKLLAHYERNDTDIFFGREREIQQLTSLIHAHRLVLLYGVSGTGKTSLLLAGAAPLLASSEPAYEVLYVRGRTDPVAAISREITRLLPDTSLQKGGSLLRLLEDAIESLQCPLVIILDQFEEFFLLPQQHPDRQLFIEQLSFAYEVHALPVKCVFALREDWLASMSEFEAHIPAIFRIKMRLYPLNRHQASLAITQPVKRVGMEYEPSLVDKLLDDLSESQSDDISAGSVDGVMPPQLQLVCNALYERARNQERVVIGSDDYDSIGGGEGILARHLAEALREHPSEEQITARAIMVALVTDKAVRTWCSLEDIVVQTGEDIDVIKKVLARLVRQWLVRRVDDNEIYELTHDILANTVASWIEDEEREVKQIQQLVRRELGDWREHQHVLPSLSKFERINRVRDRLRLTEAEIALLLQTSILYDVEVPHWLSQVQSQEQQIENIMIMLRNNTAQTRVTAAQLLSEFDSEDVTSELVQLALRDPERRVCTAAAESLGQRSDHSGVQSLVNLALTGSANESQRAVEALAVIQDLDIERPLQSGVLRLPVFRRLAALRWHRNLSAIRSAALVGAIGGAIAFAFGFPPFIMLQATVFEQGLPIGDIPFIVLLSAFLGLPAGAGLAGGVVLGNALLPEKELLGRLLGAVLLGATGFAIALAPPAFSGWSNPIIALFEGGLFGAIVATALAIPGLGTSRRLIRPLSAIAGGTIGMLLYTALYKLELLDYLWSVSILAISGAIIGLVMALTIAYIQRHWPLQTRKTRRSFRLLDLPAAGVLSTGQ